MKAKENGRSASRDQDSKYLLTGMARCFHCGGPMTIVGQDYHRRKGRFYGCSYYKTRGSSICKNSLLVEQRYLDQVVLKSLHEALTEEMLKVAIDKALAKHRAGEGAKLDRRTDIQRELSLIEAYEKNLVDAIAKGQPMDPLLAKLKAEEARKKELVRELERNEAVDQVTSLDHARIKRELNARLADTKALLGRHIAGSRRLLRALLEHPLRCEAVKNSDQKEYRITGTGSYLPLFTRTNCPPRISRKSLLRCSWCPQRDSSRPGSTLRADA